MRFLTILFVLLTTPKTFSQKLPEIDALNRVILNQQDRIIYAHVLPEDQNKKFKVSNEYWYFWYAQYDIKETKGGYDGKLLHGEYTEFYTSKELKQKGNFKKGLKTGEWKSWYNNGQLSEIVHYKNGVKEGEYTSYTTDGSIQSTQKYRKGELIVKKERAPKDTTEALNKKDKRTNKKSTNPEQPTEELQKEKKKKGKEPKVRVRRSIKIVPQPGKST